jgi:hypothetical protein
MHAPPQFLLHVFFLPPFDSAWCQVFTLLLSNDMGCLKLIFKIEEEKDKNSRSRKTVLSPDRR